MSSDLLPMSLEEMNEVAELQTRVDRKYIVSPETVDALLRERSREIRMLEIDRSRTFTYRSIYFDTPDFALYLAAARRRRRRYKVRTRHYVDSNAATLEVKVKGPRGATVKHRLDYSPTDLEHLSAQGRSFVESSVGLVGASEGLRSTLTTRYQRATFVHPESGSRLTCDSDLTCTDFEGRSVSLGQVVVESKSAGGASPFDRWLWANGIRPTRISKFCTGLAALHPELPANKWHRTLETWFRPAA